MLSDIKPAPAVSAFNKYMRLFWSFGVVCMWRSGAVARSSLSLCSVRGSRLPGISRWAEESLNLQPYLGRSPSASSEVDILLSWETRLCAPRFASVKSLRTVWTACFPNSPQPKTLNTERKPIRTFRPSSCSSAQFDLRLFLLLQTPDVTGCVPNPEVCVSGNGAQMPPGGQTAVAAPPVVRCPHETAQVPNWGPGTFRRR